MNGRFMTEGEFSSDLYQGPSEEDICLKLPFGLMVSILKHTSILCGGKRAGPPKFVGEYEENSIFSFLLSHTNF